MSDVDTRIKPDDIRVGDNIKALYQSKGITEIHSGNIGRIDTSHQGHELITDAGGILWTSFWWNADQWQFFLMSRPEKPLPTEAGSLIIATLPNEDGPRPLTLRQDGRWWYLNYESHYRAEQVKQHPWVLAEVKAVKA